MEMSDCSWQHQIYARPEIYVVSYVFVIKLRTNFPIFNTNDGRTPKHSEYRYANQISSGNTRNMLGQKFM